MTLTTSQVRRYHNTINRLRRRTVFAAEQLWLAVDGISERDRLRFLSAIEPVITASQTIAADVVTAYLTDATAEDLGVVDFENLALRTGTDFETVYSRPFVTARTALSEGSTYGTAVTAGVQRLRHLTSTDVQIAHRDATHQLMGRSNRIVGYRRVLTGDSCQLCAVASTQRYRTDRLMPIHENCDCGVAAIIGDSDPGRVINRDLLNDLSAASDRPDYWNDRRFKVTSGGEIVNRDDQPFRVSEVQHGEKGPWLTDASHEFAQL